MPEVRQKRRSDKHYRGLTNPTGSLYDKVYEKREMPCILVMKMAVKTLDSYAFNRSVCFGLSIILRAFQIALKRGKKQETTWNRGYVFAIM